MFVLAITLLLGFFLRVIGLNWDQGMHLHPDERMLIMVAVPIHFFSNLNPNFFNYGSLPIYLLSTTAQIIHAIFPTSLSLYDSLLYIGRALSLTADLVVILLINRLSWKLFKNRYIASIASLLYALSFFPIQNSHFFIVDTFLNLFILLTLYTLLRYIEKRTTSRLMVVAITFAAALTTKVTAVIFLPFILCLIFYQNRKDIAHGVSQAVTFLLLLLPFSFIFMPFAFLNWQKFIADVSLQLKLGSDPYVFPYTLQYVGTVPYLYYLKNIFLWGLGPVVSALSLIGIVGLIRGSHSKSKASVIFLAFYVFYFILIGFSAVKFMRYMLPIYPFMTILAAYGLALIRKKTYGNFIVVVLLVIASIWTLLLNSIYLKEHTRITASNWILTNLPQGSILAVEHWDDRLPIYYSEQYKFEELQLYNQPDNKIKWTTINNQLSRADYLVIASNRLYAPIQKLDDCKKYKSCYPVTSKYYEELFDGRGKFIKIKEFSVHPQFQISNFPDAKSGFAILRNRNKFQIKDSDADESFTVYDHPTIMIFKNTAKLAD